HDRDEDRVLDVPVDLRALARTQGRALADGGGHGRTPRSEADAASGLRLVDGVKGRRGHRHRVVHDGPERPPRDAGRGRSGGRVRLLLAEARGVGDLAEPLVDQVVVLAGLAQVGHRRLELLQQSGVAHLDGRTDDLAGVVLLDEGEGVVRLRRRVDRGDVRDDRVDLTGLDALGHEARVLELDRLDAVVRRVRLTGRRLLDAGLLALEVLDGRDVRVLL